MGRVSWVAPQRTRMGCRKHQKRRQKRAPLKRPNQKEMEAIRRASSGAFRPSARAKALAPPTPNRLEMAVSMRKEE